MQSYRYGASPPGSNDARPGKGSTLALINALRSSSVVDMKRRLFPAIVAMSMVVAAMAPVSTLADETASATGRAWTLVGYFENDLFAHSDRNYTNGVKFAVASPDLEQFRDNERFGRWTRMVLEFFPFIERHSRREETEKTITLTFGQQTYTPNDIAAFDLIPDDRPYAGWLYLGTGFHSRTPHRMDSFTLQLGVVGSWSLAEDAQIIVHEFRDLQRPNGWDNQLANELGINLGYERKIRFAREELPLGLVFDAVAHAGGVLGNVSTYANAGGQVRIGLNAPRDFGGSFIRPSGVTEAPVGIRDPRLGAGWRGGMALFALVDGRVVARDITLDGNTFADSHRVDRQTLVGDAAIGFTLMARNATITYSRVYRTRTFEGQEGIHEFGSLTGALVWRW